jgi:hypothetical protein
MNKAGFLVLSAVMSMGSLLFVETGCGGESAGGSGGTGGAASSTSGSAAKSSSTTTTSSSSGGMVAAATCATYCKDVTTNCTAANGQYKDAAECEAVCAKAGFTAGMPGATMGNTLECRAYHGGAPSKMTPAMHCGHAGITGGDQDPTAEGGPVCGDGVEAFCKLAVETCKGQTGAWADAAACTTEMKTVAKSTTPFSYMTDTAGNTFNCRAYHLIAAVGNPMTHCPHIKADSGPCK